MAKEAVLETVNMYFGDDGILRIKIKEGAVIGLKQIKLQYETIIRLCGTDRVAVLIHSEGKYEATREAQAWNADHAGNRIGTAVIASGWISAAAFNLYLTLFKPSSPYRLFSDEDKAVQWLKDLIRNNNK